MSINNGQTANDRVNDFAGKMDGGKPDLVPSWVYSGELIAENPTMREPVIEGVIRQAETLNIISMPKVGKSWFVLCLLLCIATGRMFLGKFKVKRSRVLLLDNELHTQTLSKRIRMVAEAMGILRDEYADWLAIEPLRGKRATMDQLVGYAKAVGPSKFGVICIDAFYRTMPEGFDENSNADMTSLYNMLDEIAGITGAAIICIHHASKGNQSSKAVTDVGSGAGAQSRAADAHMVLRPHEQDDCVVVEAEVRSWPAMKPFCLRREFPMWKIDETLDPSQLKQPGSKRKAAASTEPEAEPEPQWDYDRFVGKFITSEPQPQNNIVILASEEGISERQAAKWLQLAVIRRGAFEWTYPGDKKRYLCTREQSVIESVAVTHTSKPRKVQKQTRKQPKEVNL